MMHTKPILFSITYFFMTRMFNFTIFSGGSHALLAFDPSGIKTMNNPSNIISPSLATSSTHLVKERISGSSSTSEGAMTVSNNTESASEAAGGPPCKKLKLEIEVTNNFNSKSMKQKILEKRLARRARLIESYKDNMSELFFLQSKGNVVDLPAFRRRPSQQYLNFLKSNNAPGDVMDEVRLAVLGPNAVFEKPVISVSTSASGKVTVTSAAMAAAVVAAHGSNWKTITSASTSEAVTTTSTAPSKPPYSPRSNLLSPVKYGDQLQPFNSIARINSTSTASNTASGSYASYRLPPAVSRDLLVEKARQEAWVARRVNELSREGLWSEKRLPKICERPRPRTHWDAVLSEVQWLAVDFHEERNWKIAAAKRLAYSAKVYVEQQAERRARKAAALEKGHRKIAKFMATQVELFWSRISLHSEPISSNNSTQEDQHKTNVNELYQGEASSESGVCNLDDEEDMEDSDVDVYDEDVSILISYYIHMYMVE